MPAGSAGSLLELLIRLVPAALRGKIDLQPLGHLVDLGVGGRHIGAATGRPGDDTPNGTYVTIEKANPVDMVGPGYNIEVPWSVRFTFSGGYLHDADWSVGEQGF